MNTLLEDKRGIECIRFADGSFYAAGIGGITRIVVYGEPALWCDVPWFAVYSGDVVFSRHNAASVAAVEYQE